jgi:hypothetical protein
MMQVIIYPDQTLSPQFYFPCYPLQISTTQLGISHADGIDPDDSVVSGQQFHNLMLAGRIAFPIIRKTDDIFSFQIHAFSSGIHC